MLTRDDGQIVFPDEEPTHPWLSGGCSLPEPRGDVSIVIAQEGESW